MNENGERDDVAGRFKAFFRKLGVPSASDFPKAIDGAVKHAIGAPKDLPKQTWKSIGPRNVGGAVRALVQDPTTKTVFYAGSAGGGVWKSQDDGNTWRSLGGSELSLPIGALALAPSNSQVLYVGTGERLGYLPGGRGIFRSGNGGDSFTQLIDAASGAPGASHRYTSIQVDTKNADRFWAAADPNLWRFEPGTGFVDDTPPGLPAGSFMTDLKIIEDPVVSDELVLLLGVSGVGIFRGVFDRSKNPLAVAWTKVTPVGPAGGAPVHGPVGRVVLCFAPPHDAYAIMEDLPGAGAATVSSYPTTAFRSTDLGVHWTAGATRMDPPPAAGGADGQADYCLVIAAHPHVSTTVVAGYVDLFESTDGGDNWRRILHDSDKDRAQHADQHAILFDFNDPNQLWVGNDGGVSMSPDNGTNWMKKSFGLYGAQYDTIAVNQNYAFMTGGGLQDNGTFVSFGGPTWYAIDSGDGGQMAFDPNGAWNYIATFAKGVDQINITAPIPASPAVDLSVTLPDVDPPANVMNPNDSSLEALFPAANGGLQVGVIDRDRASPRANLLVGRSGAAFFAAGFPQSAPPAGLAALAPLATPAFTPDSSGGAPDVTAVTFGPAPGAATDWWIGTETGDVVLTTDSGAHWADVSPPPLKDGSWIATIVVHPTNANVVAVATAEATGRVFLSHDKGGAWVQINGAAQTNLPPSPIPSLAFDPTNPRVLYAGTIAGVYVARDLPAFGGAPAALAAPVNPTWKTFSAGLPLAVVNGLVVVPVTNTLRCSTYGRGMFEVNLPGATAAGFTIPDVLLSIRSHVMDDGRDYPAANTLFDDPRLPPPGAPATKFDFTRAYDIRVDAGGLRVFDEERFGETIDGCELDEQLVSEVPIVGDLNYVYVQVHNRGTAEAKNVDVHLYFAAVADPPPGSSPTPPNVDARLSFPDTPTADSPWQRTRSDRGVAVKKTIGTLRPGEPRVVRFVWVPPASVRENVALLAICTCGQDTVALPAAAKTDAGMSPIDLVGGAGAIARERRAALRITKVVRDMVFIRDGVDDDGTRGSIAWGGRSPDIIIRQGPVADPDGTFKELEDGRYSDVAKAGPNFAYVRVSNMTGRTTVDGLDLGVTVDAKAQLFQVPAGKLLEPKSWVAWSPPVAVAGIDPQRSKFAAFGPQMLIDPDPTSPTKSIVFVALVSHADDPAPDPAKLPVFADLNAFWTFFRTGPLANNVAVRGIRWAT